MQLQSVVVFVALAATVSASAPANPVVKHLAARAINVDGSFAGLIYKRQSSCATGYTSCGSGCALGPCCDNNNGLACRAGEVCTVINGEPGCCPEGYTCGSIRGCQSGLGSSCTPGSVDANGVMCCDAAAPICSTSSGVPYCAGAAPSTVYTVNPTGAGSGFDSTVTNSVTSTATLTVTADTTATVDTTATDNGGNTGTDNGGNTGTVAPGSGETTTAEITATATVEVPTDTITGGVTIQTSMPTEAPAPTTETMTTTAVVVVPVPYPSGNGTGNATATTAGPPSEQTGAASKFGVSGFALAVALGAYFL